MHIIETLIYERAPKLTGRTTLFKAVRPLLYRMLAFDAAVFLADAIHDKTGHQAFARVTEHINPRIAVRGLNNLPRKGRCVIMCNHPTGLADGMAVFQAISERRPKHTFLANADALRIIPNGHDIIIPVEWAVEKRTTAKTRETLVNVKKAFEDEKCVVIFPSGRLAGLTWHGLKDRPWQNSAAMLAKKYDAPVIPLKIKARNSWLYYLLSRLNEEMRDITLFHELLNKKGRTFNMTFGEVIAPENLPKNAEKSTSLIRSVVETL